MALSGHYPEEDRDSKPGSSESDASLRHLMGKRFGSHKPQQNAAARRPRSLVEPLERQTGISLAVRLFRLSPVGTDLGRLGGFEHEHLDGEVGVDVVLAHERDYLALELAFDDRDEFGTHDALVVVA